MPPGKDSLLEAAAKWRGRQTCSRLKVGAGCIHPSRLLYKYHCPQVSSCLPTESIWHRTLYFWQLPLQNPTGLNRKCELACTLWLWMCTKSSLGNNVTRLQNAQHKGHAASCSTIASSTMQHPILSTHRHEAYKSVFTGLGKYFKKCSPKPKATERWDVDFLTQLALNDMKVIMVGNVIQGHNVLQESQAVRWWRCREQRHPPGLGNPGGILNYHRRRR